MSGSNGFPVDGPSTYRLRYSGNTRNRIHFNLVLPDYERYPAKATQLPGVPLIPFAVAANFVSPERWQLMLPDRKPPTMPEIAVDENCHPCIREDEIRTAGESAIMLSEFEPRGL